MEKEKSSSRNKRVLMVMLGIAVISAWIYMMILNRRDKRISDARSLFEERLQEIEDYRDPDDTIKSIKVETNFHDRGDRSYYNQIDQVDITVIVPDSFEYISAQNACKMLHVYQADIENIVYKIREESGYEEILRKREGSRGYIKYRGRYAIIQNEYNVNFESTNREYRFYPSYFYVTNKNWGGSTEYRYEFYKDALIYFKASPVYTKKKSESSLPSTKSSSSETKSYGTNKKKSSYKSYDDGYDAVYYDEDYDEARYWSDSDYADGVDDAMDEFDW